ncbi:MAG: hypothetical protein NDI60_02835 [Elusimicrobiales bacterium]|nr:hypothetical protein [Elusimicrobiales bacterium]
MATFFSETLRELRREAGFETAYKFFYGSGGQKILKTSYRKYLLFEQGKRNPPLADLAIYIYSLRLIPGSHAAVRLITAWLRTNLGEDGFKGLVEPLLKDCPAESISSPLHKAVKKALQHRKFFLTPGQTAVITKNEDNYLCWLALSNDTGKWSAAGLAERLGLKPGAAAKALKEFAAVKLLILKKGAYSCPMAGGMIELNRGEEFLATQKKLNALRKKIISDGEVGYIRSGIVRASVREFSNCIPLLSLNISTAHTYQITEARKDSALLAVECKVVKIRDF